MATLPPSSVEPGSRFPGVSDFSVPSQRPIFNIPGSATEEEAVTNEAQDIALGQETRKEDIIDQLIPFAMEENNFTFEDDGVTIRPMTPEEIEAKKTEDEKFFDAFGRTQYENVLLSQGLGYDPERGGIFSLSEEEQLSRMTPIERTKYNITKNAGLALEKALAGDYSDPLLEQQLAKGQQILDEGIARSGGTRGGESTAGIQKQSAFDIKSNILRDLSQKSAIANFSNIVQGFSADTRATVGQQAVLGTQGVGGAMTEADRRLASTVAPMKFIPGATPGILSLANLSQRQQENITSKELFEKNLATQKDIAKTQTFGNILGSGLNLATLLSL